MINDRKHKGLPKTDLEEIFFEEESRFSHFNSSSDLFAEFNFENWVDPQSLTP